jgi:hypothetical protein
MKINGHELMKVDSDGIIDSGNTMFLIPMIAAKNMIKIFKTLKI